VGVGRYTSPETMVSLVNRGVLDLIGSARPSIADPFLPQKIKEGRFEDIRECIGCNICVTGDLLFMPIRCTQNPTMGEEWKRGWHPEVIPQKKSEKEVLVVGGGPAGLECARALGARGYDVLLTEARRKLGGRVELESQLPGLIEWRRVMEWRLNQIEKMPNVSVYPSSLMEAEDVIETGMRDVIIATGARWRRDGIGRSHWRPISGHDLAHVYSPDDIMADKCPSGHVLIFDDDCYYMGSVIAEKLVALGCEVSIITPQPLVSAYTKYTLEQGRIEARMRESGVCMRPNTNLDQIYADGVAVSNSLTGNSSKLACDAVVLVTDRLPNDALYQTLKMKTAVSALNSLRVIGDADAPNLIERAVFAGHLAAREFEQLPVKGTPFRIERTLKS